MSDITTFNFQNTHPIRTVLINGTTWFVAKDICDAVEINNSRDAILRLDDDEVSDVALTDTSSNGVIQRRDFKIVNESGMYALILRSRKAMQKGTPQHTFRKWVTAEVLPTIRGSGSYKNLSIKKQQKFKDCGRIWEALNRFRTESWMSRERAESMFLSYFEIKHIDDICYERIPEALELIYQTLASTQNGNKSSHLPSNNFSKSALSLANINLVNRRLSAIEDMANMITAHEREQGNSSSLTIGVMDGIADLSQQAKACINSIGGGSYE